MEKPNLWIKAVDIKGYLTNQFAIEAVNFYIRFKRCGLPYAGGWAEMPKRLLDIIDLLAPYDDIYHPPVI